MLFSICKPLAVLLSHIGESKSPEAVMESVLYHNYSETTLFTSASPWKVDVPALRRRVFAPKRCRGPLLARVAALDALTPRELQSGSDKRGFDWIHQQCGIWMKDGEMEVWEQRRGKWKVNGGELNLWGNWKPKVGEQSRNVKFAAKGGKK